MLMCRDQLTVGDHHAQGWCHNYSDPLNKTMGGCNGLSPVESESMMSFWSMFASPMLMSNDLRTVTPWAKASPNVSASNLSETERLVVWIVRQNEALDHRPSC